MSTIDLTGFATEFNEAMQERDEFHDAPDGIEMPARGKRPGYTTRGHGLRESVEKLRPKVCFFGHHHVKIRTEIAGVPVYGLNLVGREGWLVAWDTDNGFVGEWF